MPEIGNPPLTGLRVLDFGQVLALPYTGMMLADQGAEVIKVEPLTGDPSRKYMPPDVGGESPFYLSVNRNKLSVALDLKSDSGRDAVLAMVAGADVVLENFRPGVMDRFGLGYDVLSAINPGLIYCAVSGYGRSGPMKDRAGYDPIAQAESGIMAITGEPDGPATRVGVSIVDVVTGIFSAQAVTAALYARKETGKGQVIESTLFATAVNLLSNFSNQSLLAGDDPTRIGSGSQAAQPAGVFQTADSEFMLTIAAEHMYKKFCDKVLERPEMATDPRYKTNKMRVTNRLQLADDLNAIFATRSTAEWLERMRAEGIPSGEILSVRDALASPMADAVNLISTAPHSTLGDLKILNPTYSFSGTPVREHIAPPLLGQHTREVLRDVAGFDADRIEAMIEAGEALAWEEGA